MPDGSTLSLEVAGGVAWATLDRPEKLNAMGPGFWAELRSVLDRVQSDDDARVLVFRGAGRCFSVGGDIEGFGTLGDIGQRRAYVAEALGALRAVEELPKPTIAAVHGFAYGGGCELTMVCDLVVADDTARFATPEAGVGLMPGLAIVRGRAHAGLHAMKHLALTGEPIDAEQARLAGLVNTVTPAGGHEAEAARLAALMAKKAPLALAAAKRILGRGSDEGYAYAIEAVSLLQSTDDHAEGIAAFAAKRDPEFRGR
ncbi:MAG: enoyl-CoA hydratase/isomerase family protein [Solirubrobacterales bacterium]|jgi:enoyl-CoA hydratase/carnithine racemase|nr:enoyl-CoA hydratase/isomerase family protein [Solirubrobacterales bacterium]